MKIKHIICLLIYMSISPFLVAQVSYQNNATAIGSSATTSLETISNFVVASGADRLLLVYITFEQSGSPAVAGISYNGNSLNQGVAVNYGTLYSQIWYLTLGDGDAITSDIVATFTGNPNTVVGAASYSAVDQNNPFGDSQTSTGSSTSPSVSLSSSSSDHLLVANLAIIGSIFSIATSTPSATGQIEILETTNGHDQTGASNHLAATGGSDIMSWTLSEYTGYAVAAAELNLAPDCDPATATLPTGAATYTSSYSTTDGDGWTHYCDGSGNLLLSLQLGGSGAVVPDNGVSVQVATPTAQYYSTGTGFVSNGIGAVFFNRSWNVSPTTQPSSNVPVRFYFTAAEYAAVNSALTANSLSSMSSETELVLYKATSGAAHAAISSLATGDVIQLTSGSASTSSWALGSHNSDHFAEFQVSAFSGGGGGSGGGGLYFPVILLHFSGRYVDGANLLEWTTASEQNSSHFEVERLISGNTFQSIGRVLAAGNPTEPRNYSFEDAGPPMGDMHYYRLKQVDLDGSFEYSPKIEVLQKLRVLVEVYPNPFYQQLEIRLQGWKEGRILFELFAPDGRKIQEKSWEHSRSSLHKLSWQAELPAGMYIYRLSNSDDLSRMGKLLKR